MNQLSYIRSRINALRRKFALEISHNEIRTMVDDHCLQWTIARAERKPAPDDFAFFRKVAAAGYRLPTFTSAHSYLQRCLAEKTVPGIEHLLGALLPWAVARGLVVPSADPPPLPAPEPA